MSAIERHDRAASRGRSAPRSGRHWVAVSLLSLMLMPAMTTSAAFQDMASMLEGPAAAARWQTYFVPSPAGSLVKAELAFADSKINGSLPKGSGVRAGDGELLSVKTPRAAYESPDEARVSRTDKGRRVISSTASTPQKAFSTKSILERQSALSPLPIAGDAAVRLAFSPPSTRIEAVQVAMNFAPTVRGDGPAIPRGTPDNVMLASLRPAVTTGPTGSALAYAAPDSATATASLFEKILKEPQEPFVPPVDPSDHSWAATPLPASAFTEKEQACLASGVYFEARGESELGQAAVAQVILNRVRNPAYPSTICGVVYQNKDWRNRCQFSFACDGRRDRVRDDEAWEIAKRVADQVTKGEIWINDVGSATHYHATYVRPRWARAMEKVDKIGRHIFYRTFGGGWN
ncbi:cell wall hydrolase [Consotaella salsifontis]|uniref:Cell wall hydrolase CwlJ, involved in spore germination n=1 Tax=Consotaella salsifontis TaxID=1365950 RepID=A0A1T4N2E5_9HYPH|nr:cell wall hydrolase [Consotaella salsifontis]SJZ73038.1 Cell wall hydrolase CwlJ, involved in spore germination [Consotaella salsifontis]